MWTEAINSLFKMITKLAEVKETSIENQSETTVNTSVKSASKAIKAANKALDIACKYEFNFNRKDLREFVKQKKIFDDNIGSK